MADRKRAFIPLRTRLAIAYVALAVVVSALLTAALLLAFRAQLRRDLERNLTRLVAVAATTIDGDLHGTLRTRQDEGSPTYARLKRELQQVRKACGGEAAYVYTMRATAEGEFIFVVDAETDPALVSHLGDVYDDASPWLREHGPRLAEPTVEPGLNTDAWGTWMSAFAPLHTSRGAVDGVIGIDIPAASVMRAERRVWLISLLAFLATLPLAAGLGWWLGRRLSRPVVSLREAAVALAEGDFSQRAQCERGDEIGDLGRAFDAMAARLQQSYEELESRVAARTADLADTNAHLRGEIEERRRLEYTLRAMAEQDGLTGLANRLAFEQRLDEEWRRAAREGGPVSVLMCDVDHFKAYNDRNGHLAGDACLRAIADVIRRTLCRAGDLAARWGGEEFAVILASTPEDGAAAAAERLRQATEDEALPRGDAKSPVVTVSVGAATAYPAWHSAPDGFLETADRALYGAKAAGRNCVRAATLRPRAHPHDTEASDSSAIPA